MALENARRLIRDMQTDDEFRTKCAGIITELEKLVQKVKAAGYDITGEELLAAEKEYRLAGDSNAGDSDHSRCRSKDSNTYSNKIFYGRLEPVGAMWPW